MKAEEVEEVLGESQIAAALNEWMRRFVEEPARFEREFETVDKFKIEGGMLGGEASYGVVCAAYLLQIHKEISLG